MIRTAILLALLILAPAALTTGCARCYGESIGCGLLK